MTDTQTGTRGALADCAELTPASTNKTKLLLTTIAQNWYRHQLITHHTELTAASPVQTELISPSTVHTERVPPSTDHAELTAALTDPTELVPASIDHTKLTAASTVCTDLLTKN